MRHLLVHPVTTELPLHRPRVFHCACHTITCYAGASQEGALICAGLRGQQQGGRRRGFIISLHSGSHQLLPCGFLLIAVFSGGDTRFHEK